VRKPQSVTGANANFQQIASSILTAVWGDQIPGPRVNDFFGNFQFHCALQSLYSAGTKSPLAPSGSCTVRATRNHKVAVDGPMHRP